MTQSLRRAGSTLAAACRLAHDRSAADADPGRRDSRPPTGTGRAAGRAGRPSPVRDRSMPQRTGRRLAQPDVDQRADDRAHHLVAERVGPDLEAQQAPSSQARRPAGLRATRRTSDGSAARRRRPSGRRQNDVKSCSPISGSQRQPHRRQQVERLRARATPSRPRNGFGTGAVQHVVAVAPPRARRTGRRSRRRRQLGRRARRSPARTAGSAALHDGRRGRAVGAAGRQLTHLTPGVHAGVGAPGAVSSTVVAAATRRQRARAASPTTVRTPAFGGEPVERRAVVGDDEHGHAAGHGVVSTPSACASAGTLDRDCGSE